MNVGSPSPVGAFPAGNRGRLVDLAGNVWEWTNSVWQEGAGRMMAMTDDSPRVVRGGAWFDVQMSLRSAARFTDAPWNRHMDLGFRVVVRVTR